MGRGLVILSLFLTACTHVTRNTHNLDLSSHAFFPSEEKKGVSQTQADYHYMWGEALSLEGNSNKAIEAFKQVLEKDPTSVMVRLRLAAEYLKLEKWNQVIEYAEEAIDQDPTSPNGHLLLGGVYTSLRMYNKAIDQYKELLKHQPDHIEARLYIGVILAEQGEYQQAERVFLGLLKSPNRQQHFLVHYYWGRVYLDRQELAEQEGLKNNKLFLLKAKKHLQKSIRLKEDYEGAVLALIKCYEMGGESQKSIALANSFQNQFGPRRSLATYLSQVYLIKQDGQKALTQLKYLESFDRYDLKVKMQLALVLIQQKDFRQAVYKLKEILSTVPESDKVRFYLAGVYKELGERDLSIANFNKVPDSSPYYIDSVIYMVILYRDGNQVQKALQVAKKIWKKNKDVAQLHILYASLLNEQKDYKKAIQVLLSAVKLFPKHTDVRFLLGTTFDKIGQQDSMVTQMNEVLKLDDNHVQALNYLAYTYAEQGKSMDEAKRLAQKALLLEPEDPYILDTMGWIFFKMGEVKKAIPFLEAAHQSEPKESVIAEHLGDAYYKYKLFQKSWKAYQKAVETASDAQRVKKIQAKMVQLDQKAGFNLSQPPRSSRNPSSKDVSP